MTMPTLLDIAKLNGSDGVAGLIDEASRHHPEVTMGFARPISGIQYKTKVRTAVPSGAFRGANEGATRDKGTYENRLVECFIFNPGWECDKAVAQAYEDGAAAYIALEAAAVVEGALQTLAKQFYYGAAGGGDAKGHPGLVDSIDSALTVDATGTTANTGSSVWGVKFGPQDVGWVVGKEGSFSMGEVSEARILDGNGLPYTAFVQEMLAWTGLQVGSRYSIGRIKNLTADSGKGLTDARIAALLALYPVGKEPDVLLMTKRSLEQLRASRTATNATGAPAPIPTEAFGIPIKATEAILNTEAIA